MQGTQKHISLYSLLDKSSTLNNRYYYFALNMLRLFQWLGLQHGRHFSTMHICHQKILYSFMARLDAWVALQYNLLNGLEHISLEQLQHTIPGELQRGTIGVNIWWVLCQIKSNYIFQ